MNSVEMNFEGYKQSAVTMKNTTRNESVRAIMYYVINKINPKLIIITGSFTECKALNNSLIPIFLDNK